MICFNSLNGFATGALFTNGTKLTSVTVCTYACAVWHACAARTCAASDLSSQATSCRGIFGSDHRHATSNAYLSMRTLHAQRACTQRSHVSSSIFCPRQRWKNRSLLRRIQATIQTKSLFIRIIIVALCVSDMTREKKKSPFSAEASLRSQQHSG
jgi:hypothetical protein